MGRHYDEDYIDTSQHDASDDTDGDEPEYQSLDEDDVHLPLTNPLARYATSHEQALMELWETFLAHGRYLFGDGFLQYGNYEQFVRFVFVHNVGSNF